MQTTFKRYVPKDIFVSYLGHEATEEDIAAGYKQGQTVYNRKTGVEVFDLFTDLLHKHMNHYPEFYAQKLGVKVRDIAGYVRVMSGMKMKEWIDGYYYLAVGELLEKTDWSLGKIAEATGFSSVTSFSRAFIKRIGMPPSEWREKRRERM